MEHFENELNRIARLIEVKRINEHSFDKSTSALNRDNWLLHNMDGDFDNVLSNEQIQEVIDFWKPYEFAYKNNWKLQAMYTKISGRFDPAYSGFGMQRHLLTSFWNHESFSVIKNKAFSNLFFTDTVKSPRNLLLNIRGEYLDGKRNRLSYSEALDRLYEELHKTRYGEAIIKPADGGEGKDIRFINSSIEKHELEKILRYYHSDFVCDEVIKNHASISVFYNGSLNTMRMCTFIWKDEIRFAGAVLRMGVSGRVDNWSQGGVACGINEDGSLQKYAFTETGYTVDCHPASGISFEGHKIFKYQEAVRLVKRLHGMIPQQKYISWDITVDEDGDLVLVELNSPGSYELIEMAGYNGYENQAVAKEVFDKYLISNFFVDKATFDWNYREFSDHISLRKYCGFDKEIVVPKQIDGKAVRLVYANAISNTNIERVLIPESVAMLDNSISKAASKCVVVRI